MTTPLRHLTPSTPGRPDHGPFRVLCVCEGNICRSPVAAQLLQAALGPAVDVTSAGTRAVVGAPVAPGMVTLLREHGFAEPVTLGRQLHPDQLREADLVVTMTRRQRARVVALAPAVVRRAFTLRELARLLSDVDPAVLPAGPLADRLRRSVPAAAAQRRQVLDPAGEDIADPYGQDDAAYRQAFDEVARAVDRVAEVLVTDGR